jgi:hypothetical protein
MTAPDPLRDHMQAVFNDVADHDGDRANYWCPCHGTALTWCPSWEEAIARAADDEKRRRL